VCLHGYVCCVLIAALSVCVCVCVCLSSFDDDLSEYDGGDGVTMEVIVVVVVVSTVVRGGGKHVVNSVYGVGCEIVKDCFVGGW